MTGWPRTIDELAAVQADLGRLTSEPWRPLNDVPSIGGVFVCFGRGGSGPGAPGDPGWAAAAVFRAGRIIASGTVPGRSGGAYESGYLAMREGRLLETAVGSLPAPPEVLLVNATGLDHPRRAGLALHLGERLNVPTVGVTHRPLVATGDWPESRDRGAHSPLFVGGDIVGCWLRTRSGFRPLAVHAGWRTTSETARTIVLAAVLRSRTPEPLREARRMARTARSGAPTARFPGTRPPAGTG